MESWGEPDAPGVTDTRAACRGLLRLIESYGEATLPRELLVERCGAQAVEAFVKHGLLGPPRIAATYPCGDDRRGCVRRVSRDDADLSLPLVATCGRDPAKCEPARLSPEACTEHALSLRAFERALETLFSVHPTVSLRERPLEKLGVQRGRGRERDVFIAWQPSEPALSLALRLRETVDRPALVLVPTREGIAPDMARSYGPGGRVEVRVLSELLDLEASELVVRETLSNGRRPARVVVTPSRPFTLPALASWRDLVIYKEDESDAVIVIRVGDARVRCTHIDLGMACAHTRKPNATWRALITVCDLYGWYREHGLPGRIKMRLSRLRAQLRRLFGLTDDPFGRYVPKSGWRSRFRAFPSPPNQIVIAERRP